MHPFSVSLEVDGDADAEIVPLPTGRAMNKWLRMEVHVPSARMQLACIPCFTDVIYMVSS